KGWASQCPLDQGVIGLFECTVTSLSRGVWDNVLIHHKIQLVRRTTRKNGSSPSFGTRSGPATTAGRLRRPIGTGSARILLHKLALEMAVSVLCRSLSVVEHRYANCSGRADVTG